MFELVCKNKIDNIYNDQGEIEKGRWIDIGDKCKVYEEIIIIENNCYLSVEYPTSNGIRNTYIRIEDFEKEDQVKIIQAILPINNINRSSYKNTKKYITIHETDNTTKCANAKAHSNYLLYNCKEKISWHYTVDDKEIYQHLPEEVAGYHTTDGMSENSGNRNSIGIEICVNSDGDFSKAIENTQKLVRILMDKYDIPISNVVQHNFWYNKNCPRILREKKLWESFIKGI